MDDTTSTKFLYRGVSDSTYSLLPSVFRKREENSIYTGSNIERRILKDFISHACAYLSIPQTEFFTWAEHAQHYGVPTSFLDWTSNPLVALYFACKDCPTKNAALWILHNNNFTNFTGRRHSNEIDNSPSLTINKDITIGDSYENRINGKR